MRGAASPTVSIVTPSLNQARFLEATIASVLSQDYPRLDYLVMDGGSTDGTLDILRRYEGRLRYHSGPDLGQADAVNRGFLDSRGEIFAFLNADDTYLPGAIETAVRELTLHPEAAAVCGEAHLVDEQGRRIGRYPTAPPDLAHLSRECVICQPAVFLRSEVFREAGMLNPDLHFALDYELWIRIAQGHQIRKSDAYFAAVRVHPESKTYSRRREALREAIDVVRAHFGFVPFPWVYEYASAVTGQRLQPGEPPPRSVLAWALSAALGSHWNRSQLGSYWKECRQPVVSGWRRYLAR